MSETQFDLIIIGSGPGGYTGAIRAAQLGLTTAIVEKDPTLGGTCLNVGCIPSKALLQSSENFVAAQHDFEEHGIDLKGVKLNLSQMMKRKEKIVSDLTGGVEYLMNKNKVTWLKGLGRLKSQNEVIVTDSKGKEQTYQAKNIMLATGSVPNELPFMKYDEKVIVSSTGALSLSKVPKTMALIGGGVIGLELGSVWSRLGAEVTCIEFSDSICAGMDKGMSKRMMTILKKQGIKFELKSKVTGAEVRKDGATVKYESLKDGSEHTLDAEVVLVAVGRKPFSEGLGLEDLVF